MRDYEQAAYITWSDVSEAVLHYREAEHIAVGIRLDFARQGKKQACVVKLHLTVQPLQGSRASGALARTTYNVWPSYTRVTMASWLLQALHTLTNDWTVERRSSAE